MATLKDIAKDTGLTVSTVSRVLNNRGYLSESTKKKVQESMKRLNYQPNELARSLSKKTSQTIGVILPHIRHPYFSELLSHIERHAGSNGYKILVFNSRDKDEKALEHIDMCTSNRVAGIILCSGLVDVKQLTTLNIPLITIERHLENGTASVECDNLQGGKMAATHLIQRGCKHLLHISGISNLSMPADSRAAGFSGKCQEFGVPYHEIMTTVSEYNNLDYVEFLKESLAKFPETDGIFAGSDLIAIQLIQVCHEIHKKIPEDIKIVGFDDVFWARLSTPSITTIHQPIKEMAEKAVDLLLETQQGNMIATRTILPVSLIERGSS